MGVNGARERVGSDSPSAMGWEKVERRLREVEREVEGIKRREEGSERRIGELEARVMELEGAAALKGER